MDKTYNLFIGANNETGIVERDTVELVLNKYHDGYTITNATGYWQGSREDSLVVTVVSKPNILKRILFELKGSLKQDAIGYQEVNELKFN